MNTLSEPPVAFPQDTRCRCSRSYTPYFVD
ncbi:hypothetical protein [Pseudomonas sp. 28 E 9]|nr:hypothetical protein [Pseudomonas sp. 28 E 9]